MKMLLPPDWDKAGAGNDKLCAKFDRLTYRAGGSYLPYRLFKPDAPGKVPLVIYLHGADAAGDDNELQLAMHDIGTFLARDDIQKRHPCFILAPQYGEMRHWSMPDVREGLWNLIEETLDKYKDIDRDRIYIYGYSAGGVGTLRTIKEHPGFFAAAISICGATGSWDIDKLLEIPIWLIHAADDNIVKATYRNSTRGELANLGSHDIYEWYLKARKNADGPVSEIRYTEYAPGWMKKTYGVNPHCSWVALSDARSFEMWEWMFLKRLTKNEVIA